MQNDYDFGMKWNDRLKKACADANVIDTELAKACGVKPSSVHGWMSGDTVGIEARYLLPACKLLKVSPFYIMFGEEVPGIDMLPKQTTVEAMAILRLIQLFAQSTGVGRDFILDAAESAEKA